MNLQEIGQLARRLDTPAESEGGGMRQRELVEVEEEVVGDRVKAVTAYYGSLIADGEDPIVD